MHARSLCNTNQRSTLFPGHACFDISAAAALVGRAAANEGRLVLVFCLLDRGKASDSNHCFGRAEGCPCAD